MADTSTKVLTIDTGNAISNLKDFKARIEELKGALLGLESGTEEYNAVAKELRNSQQKLTEVMDVAKGKAEGVEGSYDNLVATMRRLKQEWRATADEATRTNLGAQILDINNQLKELDASTGNFQRNVGDYANAFESAFRAVVGGIGRFNPELGKTAATIGSLIPVIKQTATVATASLQGIKKAIASTGIGALVIAVGLVAANWEKVANAVKKAFTNQQKYNELQGDLEKSIEHIKEVNTGLTAEQEQQLRLMDAQGTSAKAILEAKIEIYNTNISDLATEIEKTKQLKAQKDAVADRLEMEANAAINNPYAESGVYAKTVLNNVQKIRKESEGLNEVIAEGEGKLKGLQTEVDILRAKLARLGTDGSTNNDSNKGEEDAITKEADKILEEIRRNGQSEFQNGLEDIWNEFKEKAETLQKAGEIAAISELKEIYNQKANDYIKKFFEERQALLDEENEKVRRKIIEGLQEEFKEFEKETETQLKNLEGQWDLYLSRLTLPYTKMEQFFGKEEIWDDSLITETFEKRFDIIDATLENTLNRLGAEQDTLLMINELLDPESDEYLNNQKRIAEIDEEITQARIQNWTDYNNTTNELEETLHQKRIARMESLSDMFSSVGNLISNIGALMEEQINAEVEDGKISEETAKKRFESVKKMQIGAAVINMAAGVVSAIAQAQQLGPILGPIMAAINSAAVIAAGAVQISQIKRTKYGSDTSGNISTPNLQRATVPIVPEPTQNITGQSELTQLSNAINSKPVIVKVTDIEDTQAIQNATTAEATF